MTKNIPAILILLWSMSVSAQSEKIDLALKDVYGRGFRLSDYKGKVVLLNFWATWCPPCRAEMPELIKSQRKYHQSLQVVGITYPPETLSQVRKFAKRIKANYPLALGNKSTKLMFSNSEVLPMTIVIDRKGEVRDVIEGILLQEEFDEKIKPLLAEQFVRTQAAIGESKRSHIQRATIKVTSSGYAPVSIRLRKGVKAEVTFIRTTDQTCGTELRIPAYDITRSLPLNEGVSVRFTPRRSGAYKITCGMNMFRGSIVVK